MNLRSSLAALGVVGFLVCALLVIYFPAVPKSALGWLALVFLGSPVWLFLEWLGEVALRSRYFAGKSSAVRIVLAVPVVAVLMVIAVLLIGFVQRVVSSV